MISIDQILMDSQAATAVVTAARLVSLQLRKRYPVLLIFFVVTALSTLGLGSVSARSSSYFWGYLFSQTLTDLIAIGVVRELFSVVVADYPGIQTTARWAMNGAVLAAAVASLILGAALWGGGPPDTGHLFYILTLHRSIMFSLAVVVVSLLIFLSHYPLELQRSTYVACYFFSAIVLIEAANTLVATLSTHLNVLLADRIAVASISGAFVTWAILMRREHALPVKITFRSPQENDALRQLEAINQMLSRVARR